MKKLTLLLLVLFPLLSFGKGDGILGHWHEVIRLGTDGRKVEFRDTIFLEFKQGNEFIWQKKNSFIQRGVYKSENGGKNLDIGIRYFTVLEIKKNKRLVLKDQAGTYEFEPYTPVSQMVPGRAPETYAPVTSINQMVGEWDKFKGTSNATQQQIDYTRTVKKVTVFSSPKDGKLGYIYAGRDGETASWYIESFSNQTLFCNGKDKRQFKVLKAANNELIIEGEGFTYFLRKFR
ncbi:MAG: hypothetical protein H6551_02190 [Chitinophagales bacterium]|nr:hypothetical protein [Chitinophagaceae bacterium]MCB9063934.1 hypothetical protein [Chitinophagales bacterium]